MDNIKVNINLDELNEFLNKLKLNQSATALDRKILQDYYYQATGTKRNLSGCPDCILQVIGELDMYIMRNREAFEKTKETKPKKAKNGKEGR